MKLLLDTHAFIWLDTSSRLLSGAAHAAIADAGNSLHVSLAGIWEMQIKQQLGKLSLRCPLAEIVQQQQADNDVRIVAIDLADILALRDLPHHHRDPFDRLMIAQARRLGFHLVTNDPEITRYDVPTLW